MASKSAPTVLGGLLQGASVTLSVRTQGGALVGSFWTAFHNVTCLSWAAEAATLDVELYNIEVTSGGPSPRTWAFEAQRSICGSEGRVNVASALPQDIFQIAGYGATIAFTFRTRKRSSVLLEPRPPYVFVTTSICPSS